LDAYQNLRMLDKEGSRILNEQEISCRALASFKRYWGETRRCSGTQVRNQGATPHPGRASARSRIAVSSDNSQRSPGLKGSSLPAGTLSSAMLSTMATVT
jgi:hypothetical protein